MGELEFKDFTICYQDENGEMKPFTSWNLNKNGLSWTNESDKERIEALESSVNNTDATLEFSPAVCSDDFIHLIETPETHFEFAEELKEELKEISREESQKVMDEKWKQWTHDMNTIIAEFEKDLKKIYNKEKEKKEEEMKKSTPTFALPIIGVQFQGSTKTYVYFVTKEVLETYFKYINDYCAITNQHLPYVTITNEVDYNYKNSKVMFIGLAKTPMMLNCPTHIITKINYAFSCAINPYELGQGSDDFRPFEKYKLAGKDWFEKISIYPVPETLCNEYFNSNMDFLALKTCNNIDETKIENKGDNKMNLNRIFPSEFIGRDDSVKMSIYGAAFKTADNRDISFSNGEWIDVTGLTFDFECPAYVLPAKKEDVAVGDFILHIGSWCRVIELKEKTLMVERIYSREISEILPTKSPFGFDFYSKLFMPFFGNIGDSAENLMSNPMALMMLCGDSNDFSDMLPFMFMNGGNFDMSNPMMLYFLMKGDKKNKEKPIELGF